MVNKLCVLRLYIIVNVLITYPLPQTSFFAEAGIFFWCCMSHLLIHGNSNACDHLNPCGICNLFVLKTFHYHPWKALWDLEPINFGLDALLHFTGLVALKKIKVMNWEDIFKLASNLTNAVWGWRLWATLSTSLKGDTTNWDRSQLS